MEDDWTIGLDWAGAARVPSGAGRRPDVDSARRRLSGTDAPHVQRHAAGQPRMVRPFLIIIIIIIIIIWFIRFPWSFTEFPGVFLCFFLPFSTDFTGQLLVLLKFIGFSMVEQVSLGSVGVYLVLPSFTG